jgi:Holliday junction resolvasome RuvABC endonuclease subunit
MSIAGADLSSRSIALVSVEPLRMAKFKVKDKVRSRHVIAQQLLDQASFWLLETGVETLFIEEPVVAGARNIRASLLIAQIAGVLLAAARDIPSGQVYMTAVSSWKKGTVGHGGASKIDVREWLSREHPEIAAQSGYDQDLCDAAVIALYGQRLLQRGNVLRSGVCEEPLLPKLA